MGRTAGIIIIGNEILSGKVQDSNSFFMAQELWSHGIILCRISVIPDIVDEIADEVRKFSGQFDYIFTSGGIGPTHDDITIEGISKAFNVRTVVDLTLRRLLEKRQGDLSPAQLKMAEVPEGSELIKDGDDAFPLIKFRNVYIFPGIPQLLKKKFFLIEKSFNEPLIYLKKVYLRGYESVIAPILGDIVKRFEQVRIGSYPELDNLDYSVMVTLESVDRESLAAAVQNLVERIPDGKLVRVEG
jgi:molybdenum cofactor synthesis domain-containing protein